uniref:Uncharacterized protein n=1 Tax=Anguilla anguilla TaxID=7936 RepID=A0A0E9W537_ANGAN
MPEFIYKYKTQKHIYTSTCISVAFCSGLSQTTFTLTYLRWKKYLTWRLIHGASLTNRTQARPGFQIQT